MVLSKMDLGKLVKKARELKSEKDGQRYTQLMLAKDIHRSQGYIGDIESGRTYPTFKVLSALADACNVPLNFFQDNVDENKTVDVKQALDTILCQSELMLNGEMLSDDSKFALANAIKLGIEYAEQMQKKEKPSK